MSLISVRFVKRRLWFKGLLWGRVCPLKPPKKRKTNPRRVQSYLLDISVTAGAPAHGPGAAQLPISAQQPVSFPLVLIQLRPASLPTLPHPSPCPYQPTVRQALFYLTLKFRSCHRRIQSRLDERTHGSGSDWQKSLYRMRETAESENHTVRAPCIRATKWEQHMVVFR